MENQEFSIEDLFPEDYYVERVKRVYEKQLTAANMQDLHLTGGGQLCKRVERTLQEHGIKFNKGSVAKILRVELSRLDNASGLPEYTRDLAKRLFQKILEVMPETTELAG